ncbi:uncharacterized protein LOC124299100 [Neodiprion virginianus]|uniref:uncharacterized protein LOC124299100 n=1 Tax=Neodiprion virginianus TaxID=2961670 RepID=UPI001EE6BEF8|nr:uncharacterized protein LOC124299100 [Neodiprion virginianus]
MAKFVLLNLVLLAVVTGGLSLTLRDIFGLNYPRYTEPEVPRIVEVIRWRQPVCLTSAPEVLPCLMGLKKYQANSDQIEKTFYSGEDGELTKRGDSDNDSSSVDSINEDDLLAKRSTRSLNAPRLYSPNVVRFVQLENMGPSSLREPKAVIRRHGKYLRLGPQMTRSSMNSEIVYDIKVVDSPVVATLVAQKCLPDIGVPLCDENLKWIAKSQLDEAPRGESSSVVVEKPADVATVVESKPVDFWKGPSNPHYNNGETHAQKPQKPAIIQTVVDYINRPNYVQTDEKPEIKPVIVVEPTSAPGLFAAIDTFFRPNGSSWFNVFYKPPADKPQAGEKPGLIAGLFQVPAIPSLQEFFYKPENDISNNQGLLGLLALAGGQNNAPGVGPPTEKPGIFGGLFPSPSKPAGLEKPTKPSLLGGIGNIFNRPTSKPLVIERPDEKPLVVEKPVYVVEQPVTQGLMNIFQKPSKPISLDKPEELEIIKEPTYILQKPTERPTLFGSGLLGNWNIFSKPATEEVINVVEEKPVHTSETVIVEKPVHIAETIIEEKPVSTVIVEEKPAIFSGLVVENKPVPFYGVTVNKVPVAPNKPIVEVTSTAVAGATSSHSTAVAESSATVTSSQGSSTSVVEVTASANAVATTSNGASVTTVESSTVSEIVVTSNRPTYGGYWKTGEGHEGEITDLVQTEDGRDELDAIEESLRTKSDIESDTGVEEEEVKNEAPEK